MASPAVLYSVSLDGVSGATFVSPNIERVLGYTPEECIGMPDWWANNIHPDERDKVLEDFTNNLPRVDHYVHEYRIRHKAGHYVWVHDELNILSSENGEPCCIAGSWLDITENVEALHLASAHVALDSLAFGVISFDEGFHILMMNSRARKIVADNDGFTVNTENICELDKPNENGTFQKKIHELLSGDIKEGAAFRVRRHSHKVPYAVLVVPPSALSQYSIGDSHRGVIFIHDPEIGRQACHTVIGPMYGLTKSEARLVASLVSGGILKETAEKIGITEGSARIYLKSIFQKTNTRNQMELVRLILSGPATLWWREGER